MTIDVLTNNKTQRVTWYCPAGHNAFESASYSDELPPECGSCGATMTINADDYLDVHEAIENREIAQYSKD